MADRWVMNNDRFFEESNGLYSTYNQSRRLLYDRWKKPGDITDIPRYGVTAQLDDRFLENSSFLRLKNLTLAYALPQTLLKKTNFFTSARVYLQGQNLLTFTDSPDSTPKCRAISTGHSIRLRASLRWASKYHSNPIKQKKDD